MRYPEWFHMDKIALRGKLSLSTVERRSLGMLVFT